MKIELYKNTNLLTRFLLLFISEKTIIKNVYNDRMIYYKYNDTIVVHFKVLFGIKYIIRQYYIH